MNARTGNLSLVARLSAVTAVGVVAMIFLSSWMLAIVVGVLTITAVAIDAWLLARSQIDQVGMEPSVTPVEKLTVDLRHRH